MSENNYLINNNRIYLRKNVRRNNYSINNNEDGLSGMNISDEIITFFLEKRNHEEYKDKLISLKKELKEEKRITEERIKNLSFLLLLNLLFLLLALLILFVLD